MDSFQKEALIRSAQQIIDENREFVGHVVTDVTLHGNSEKDFDKMGKTNIVWANVWINNEAQPHGYFIIGWRYLNNLNEVIVEHREERIKELGI